MSFLEKEPEVLMSLIRVLVVDDSPCWLDFVRLHLEGDPDVRIVGTASHGAWAVQKAKELQPDLILLDVSLPGMNGIEVALEIRKVAPKSAILMLSVEADPGVVRAAFAAGALGYVLKSSAVSDLREGMAAVLFGKRFLSRSLAESEDLA
jgi:DNA-binding NarL/FixJ family response regulator